MTDVASLSEAILARDEALLGKVNALRFFPLVAESASGCSIYDLDGREYLDMGAGWCVANTGYGHPAVVKAVAETFERISFACTVSVSHRPASELAARLVALAPGRGPKKVMFGLSGSDANDGVAKLVPLARKRPRMIAFMGGMHGMSAASAGLSAIPHLARFGNAGNVTRIPFPNPYRPPLQASNGDLVGECLRYLEEEVFTTICPPEQTSAIITEAIQSDGGVIVPPDDFLPRLEALCRKYDLLLVDDEVKIGLGRTGAMWAADLFGVRPDVVVIGKSLGGGLPISAVIASPEILDSVSAGHAFTTAASPAVCAAALATLDVIEGERLMDNAAAMGARLLNGLRALQQRHELLGDVRGKGLIVGAELVRDRERKTPAPLETAKVAFRAAQLGVIVHSVGVRSNVLEITPPLTISAAQIDQGVALLDQAFEDVERGRVPDAAVAAYTH